MGGCGGRVGARVVPVGFAVASSSDSSDSSSGGRRSDSSSGGRRSDGCKLVVSSHRANAGRVGNRTERADIPHGGGPLYCGERGVVAGMCRCACACCEASCACVCACEGVARAVWAGPQAGAAAVVVRACSACLNVEKKMCTMLCNTCCCASSCCKCWRSRASCAYGRVEEHIFLRSRRCAWHRVR